MAGHDLENSIDTLRLLSASYENMSTPEPPRKMISACPICGGELCVSRFSCGACQSHIETRLGLPPFFKLPAELQAFVMVFLRCRGSIRDVEKDLGISYPTVCKRLDLVNELLGNKPSGAGRGEVLERLERGEITAKEAAHLLKRR
jgi:hypothetical protein